MERNKNSWQLILLLDVTLFSKTHNFPNFSTRPLALTKRDRIFTYCVVNAIKYATFHFDLFLASNMNSAYYGHKIHGCILFKYKKFRHFQYSKIKHTLATMIQMPTMIRTKKNDANAKYQGVIIFHLFVISFFS